jgi:hypothetical protein
VTFSYHTPEAPCGPQMTHCRVGRVHVVSGRAKLNAVGCAGHTQSLYTHTALSLWHKNT